MNLQDMQQENIFPFFCFLYVFLIEEKKNEIWSLPHLISFPQNAASYLAIVFLPTVRLCFLHFISIFMLVFDVKVRKETNYNINRSLRWPRQFIDAWRLHDA